MPLRHTRCFTLISALIAWHGLSCFANDEATELLFAKKVLPVFKEKCFGCHGNDAKDIKGELDMRSREGLIHGGESGDPSLVEKTSDQSPLYLAITRNDATWSPMPPKESDALTPEQIASVKTWIDKGAPWPSDERLVELANKKDPWSAEGGIVVLTTGPLDADWANRRYDANGLWAYQPVAKPELPSTVDKNPIDYWIEKRLPNQAKLAGRADRRTLLRRITFDLIGLPPTVDEMQAYLDDPTSEAHAFQTVVERLLASPHYGEHWARHWLDVVRYADTSGFANDFERGSAWRYRDYVVRAFNNDKPYDAFIREQIAGDEIAEANPSERDAELLVAAGFLRMGPWELTGMEVAKIARQRFLDDVTNSVGETFLSHSLQCARCHDHKFDPIPTHDYYAVQACFATTQLSERPAEFLPTENQTDFDEMEYLLKRKEELQRELKHLDDLQMVAAEKWLDERKIDRTAWEEATQASMSKSPKKTGKRSDLQLRFDAARAALMSKSIPADQIPPKEVGFSTDEFGRERVARKGLERLGWEMDRYAPVALSVYNGRTPEVKAVLQPVRMPENRMQVGELEKTAILGGGDPFSPTTEVKPGKLSALAYFNSPLERSFPDAIIGRREALADWIADPSNPLTTRSIVNRIWLWHFGQAIAGNPNNFGSTGKKPTHPELLDYLAATFVEQGWSFKEMHRKIVSSDAYQRAAKLDDSSELSRGDLEACYAVFRPRRLTAEEFRDAMLVVSGELNRELGGIPNRPEMNLEAALQPRQVMGTFAAAWVPNPLPSQRHRRSIYALRIRGLRDPFMEVFNEPGPDFSCEARDVSTVTPQVFSLFNGQASYDRALAFAHRMLAEKQSREATIEAVFTHAFGRMPTETELISCREHWAKMEDLESKTEYPPRVPPRTILREAVEENTGEKFQFTETLEAYADFVSDLQPQNVDASTRGLADLCLVLFNANEFAYVY